jgi:hypothetical protein
MKPIKFNKRTEALAFRIWQYAKPIEWNIRYDEVADALGVSNGRVRAVCTLKKWTNRFRAPPSSGGFEGRIAHMGIAGAEVFDHRMDLADQIAEGAFQ